MVTRRCIGLADRAATLRIGLDRASYCPTTAVDDPGQAPGVDDDRYGLGDTDGVALAARAWAVPLFLGLNKPTAYEWAPLPGAEPSETCCACLASGAFNLCHECQGVCRTACEVEAADCAARFPRLGINLAS